MTYFAFLGLFLLPPAVGLWAILAHDRRRGTPLAGRRGVARPATAIALTALVAVLYTTPWDNYLVATGVWFYDASRVSGVVLGVVPLEEYLFFVLQAVVTSLWLVVLRRRSGRSDGEHPVARSAPLWASLPVLALWLVTCVGLRGPWGPSRYAELLLAWALPPILLQLAFGADLLWRERRSILPAVLIGTIYYCAADVVAVGAGTWSFHPGLTLGFSLGPLPIEEVLFFLLTNTLIVFSVTLLLSPEAMMRLRHCVELVQRGATGPMRPRA